MDVKRTLTEAIASVRQMVVGLTANAAQVAERGVSADFIARGKEIMERVQKLNDEQEALKTAAKLKTEELNAAADEMKAWQSEATKAVKLAYHNQPTKWSDFGLTAKR
jgi:hypothetical protein